MTSSVETASINDLRIN